VHKIFNRHIAGNDPNKTAQLMNERKALTTLKHPNLNWLIQTTKSDSSIGFLLDLAKGVDIYKLLKLYGSKLPS